MTGSISKKLSWNQSEFCCSFLLNVDTMLCPAGSSISLQQSQTKKRATIDAKHDLKISGVYSHTIYLFFFFLTSKDSQLICINLGQNAFFSVKTLSSWVVSPLPPLSQTESHNYVLMVLYHCAKFEPNWWFEFYYLLLVLTGFLMDTLLISYLTFVLLLTMKSGLYWLRISSFTEIPKNN